jgi:serine/threonine protein kinase
MIDINSIKKVFLPEYEIIEVLGVGGMATVFKAIQVNLGRMVALKIIPKEFSQNHEFKIRFEREAIDAAKLTHPNIITIYDSGEKAGYQYISMAFLQGGNLRDLIRKKGYLKKDEAKNILIRILEGIGYAHKNGIIHRDLKSSNIMFDYNWNPVIMDFGISKSKDSINLTVSGSFIGTLEYASPEQIESSDKVDIRSDLYSVGIIAYEMLTGDVPFKGTMTTLINKILNEEPPKIEIKNKYLDKSFCDIIEKAIKKDPQQRYQDSAEFINAMKVENNIIKDKNKKRKKSSKDKNNGKKNKGNSSVRGRQVLILSMIVILILLLTILMLNDSIFKDSDINGVQNKFGGLAAENTLKSTSSNKMKSTSVKSFKKLSGVDLIKINGGKFLMGTDNGRSNEAPEHIVNVKSFYIMPVEVTQDFWKKVMKKKPAGEFCEQCPVVNVSWYDAKEFIKKVNALTGLKCRLPYESEWEYAATNKGNSNFVFSGGVDLNQLGWYVRNSGGRKHKVALKKPNDLGIYDMSGNVWEWCQDYYDPYFYRKSNSPYGPRSGSKVVIRGGSFSDDMLEARVTRRIGISPNSKKNNIGFRLVCFKK